MPTLVDMRRRCKTCGNPIADLHPGKYCYLHEPPVFRTRVETNKRPTHCRKGHELTPENTYASKGKRCCAICRLERNRRAEANRKAKKLKERGQ